MDVNVGFEEFLLLEAGFLECEAFLAFLDGVWLVLVLVFLEVEITEIDHRVNVLLSNHVCNASTLRIVTIVFICWLCMLACSIVLTLSNIQIFSRCVESNGSHSFLFLNRIPGARWVYSTNVLDVIIRLICLTQLLRLIMSYSVWACPNCVPTFI